MKKTLKVLKWLSLGLISILLIAIIYLAITGFPNPSTMTTENVPRLPFTILKTAQNANSESSKYLIMKGWSKKEGEGIYALTAEGFSRNLALISEPGAEPKIMNSEVYGMNTVFSPDPEANFFLYTKDNTEGAEKKQIFRFDVTTKESTMLTNGEAPHSSPRFTRDGKQFIYSVRNEKTLNSNLYIRDIENPESERLLLKGSAEVAKRGFYVDDFSPDGKHIVLRQGYYAKEPSILNFETGELTLLHPD
ncbi:MAG: PD40 domain-containing protein, partial [Croceitalea sp.]|nr:PD40 domain-containing protein [Croceitalea sp.]